MEETLTRSVTFRVVLQACYRASKRSQTSESNLVMTMIFGSHYRWTENYAVLQDWDGLQCRELLVHGLRIVGQDKV